MSHRRRILTTLASTFVMALATLSTSLADVITLTADATTKGASGGVFRGVVTSESPTKVEIKLGNTVTAIPTNEIVSITYDGHPASLDQAITKEAANALPEAVELYKKAAADASNKPFILEDAAFNQARVMAEIAESAEADSTKGNEAMAALEAFARTHKTGRHIGPALEALAKLQIARKNYPGVEQTIAQLSQLPKGEDRSAILKVKVMIQKGQTDQAVIELDKVIAGSADGSLKKRDALLAKAETLVTQKKYTEAESTVRAVIKSSGPEDASTQALAHNTLGECLLAAGRSRDALYAFLHTDLLFSKEKDEHARALSRITRIWRELNRPDRAEEVLERLKQEYPRSPYTTAAIAK